MAHAATIEFSTLAKNQETFSRLSWNGSRMSWFQTISRTGRRAVVASRAAIKNRVEIRADPG
jgi:hypothetical protein